MKKFGVFSGFLGSGKTTAMMALTRYLLGHFGKAAMISNDLGGEGLADNRFANLSGCNASELTGTCICYQTENLVTRLHRLFDEENCQIVLSDIPGFGVGALDHVYHTLEERFPGAFELAPFTVLCEPQTLEMLREGKAGDLTYILKSQLAEADIIVLNKCDKLSREEKEKLLSFLEKAYPKASCVGISARTGEGLDALSKLLITEKASLRRPDLRYGGEEFLAAIGQFSEYNLQYYAIVCCETFDGNAYLRNLAQEMQRRVQQASGELPHLKLLAWEPEGDYGKVDVLGVKRPVEITKEFSAPCRELAVIVNTSAVCGREQLDQILTQCVESISETFKLSIVIYKKECFSALGESE